MLKRTLTFLTIVIVLLPLLAACGDTPTGTVTPAPGPATGAATATTAGGAGPGEATATTAGGAGPAATNTAGSGTTASDAVMTLGGGTASTYQRNFNPFASTNLIPTLNGIYEPLMIYNGQTGELVPWLATKYEWSADNKTLTFTIRDGVKWSDGQPFTANDVAYTFNLLKTTTGLNSSVLSALGGPTAYIESITAPNATTVAFAFSRLYTPGLYELIVQNIVPEHIWKDIADPVKHTNDNPVGTGPFTEVVDFQNQSYQIERNPNYWQQGKPAIKGLRYVAFPDPNAEQLAIANGQIDWGSAIIPNADQTFVGKDPANRYYIYESGPNVMNLAVQIGKEPFDDVNVRKAISMAINREQITVVGESGATVPADVTGLGPFYQTWKVEDPASLGDWTTYNPDAANQLLDAAGLKKGGDGIRVNADGTKMSYKIPVLPAPNWLADAQIVADNLKAVGIEAQPEAIQFPVYLQTWQEGSYDMMFNIVDGIATPYRFYYRTMASELLQPVGTRAFGNSTRYAGKKADDLLKQFEASTDPAEQREIAEQLQRVFAEEVPTVPLFPLAGGGFINTARFTGFPTKEDHYASAWPNPSFFADFLLVITRLQSK